MIAIILAAGTGTRLMPLTKDIPKPLLEIGDISLLERMMIICITHGVDEFVVVVGHKKQRVLDKVDYLSNKYDVKITTVENKEYAQTNTSCSVNLATKNLDDDIMIINGDNVVDERIISGLLKMGKTSLVIDNHKDLNEESFKLRIEDNEIREIGKGIPIGTASGEFIGISKVVRDDLRRFNSILEDLIAEDVQNYYDLAYKDLSRDSSIDYFYTNGLKWTEIDDKNDWEYAHDLIEEFDNQ
ncbi:sugar phosphate nucleotidyltransferase [Methanobacterium alcaliphilum]|uniref:phosphocholine cytidylyltransferase family protein n=1 Tax=Methanobacterium alcaliphilum TaxID=392018 RepID=UPI00200B2032|nr:phosphocholine cytidylyltransferase family protein [Methanobacterium alcaliphilum]